MSEKKVVCFDVPATPNTAVTINEVTVMDTVKEVGTVEITKETPQTVDEVVNSFITFIK